MSPATTLLIASLCLGFANAHLAPFSKGMYCINGPTSTENLNSNAIVSPLWQLGSADWWFHHFNGCDNYPPPEGEFLEIPAGRQFTVEIASNRAKTTLAYGGQYTSEWPDGNNYPEDYNVPTCIVEPNMHTQNQSMAAGTAFAISYQSDLSQVTPENLVVFSVRHNTPWKRVQVYDVPAAMPPCPAGGCICAWGWVPNGCGEPNMYHTPFKCQVTNSTSNTPLATAQPPVWCEGNPDGCTKGAKQMVYWHQQSGNNIEVSGFDLSGQNKSPGYNNKLGFADGAQNDIFSGPASSAGSKPATNTTSNSGSGYGSGTPAKSSQVPSASSGSSQHQPINNSTSSSGSGTPAANKATQPSASPGGSQPNTGSGSKSGHGAPASNPQPPSTNSSTPTHPDSSTSSSKPTDSTGLCRSRSRRRDLSKKSAVQRSMTETGPLRHKRYVRVHARMGGGTTGDW